LFPFLNQHRFIIKTVEKVDKQINKRVSFYEIAILLVIFSSVSRGNTLP